MKSPIPKQFTEGIFHMQYLICTANFTNKISRSSWTWHNLWKLLTINFRNKYFHNSVDWSGLNIFIFKCISLHEWQVLRFTVFRLLENAFVKLPSSYHDLIINLPCRAIPNKFAQNNLSPICHKKHLSILYPPRHYALAPLENHVGVHPSIFARKCRIKLVNILNLAKRIVRQNRWVSLCII